MHREPLRSLHPQPGLTTVCPLQHLPRLAPTQVNVTAVVIGIILAAAIVSFAFNALTFSPKIADVFLKPEAA